MQTTATATAPRLDPSFNRLAELSPQIQVTEPEDRRERYFVFAGDFPNCPPVVINGEKVYVGGTTVETRCIPDRILWRCLVTPCISMPVETPHYAIPSGRKLNGTERYDRDQNLVSAKMLEFAGPAAYDLLRDMGSPVDPEKQRGLVELAPDLLTGIPFAEVRKLNLTFMYFPNWPYDVPATHEEVRAKIEEALNLFETDRHPDFAYNEADADSRRHRAIYIQAGKDWLRAVDQAERWHNGVAERANVDIARGDTDAKHKEGFDDLDEVAFRRTGIIKTTKQMQEMVKASRENRGSNDQVAKAVTMMAESHRHFTEAMTANQGRSEVDELKAQIAELRAMIPQPAPPAPKLPKRESEPTKG